MGLKIGEYEIKESYGLLRYDLQKIRLSEKGKEYYEVTAYGVSLERCIEIIIFDKTELAGELNDFIDSYKIESQKVLKELSRIIKQ